MLNENKVAIISTGNGGQTMAAFFASQGIEVALYAREQERVDMFDSNTFFLDGILQKQADIALISCDMEQIVRNAKLIMVTTPSQYYHVVARDMAPYLVDDQIIVLNPGRTFGTYDFDMVLRQNGCDADIILAEAETFIFTCRCAKPGHPHLYSIKSHVPLAAHDSKNTELVVHYLQRFFNDAVCTSPSVLHTAFSNMGMVVHPLPILLNITRVEKKERFLYYKEAITPQVAEVMERLDAERIAVANALGLNPLPIKQWLNERYGSSGETLYDLFQNTDAYSEVYAPTDIYTRYVFEDVCTGCVPVSCVGKELGVPTPHIQSVIDWATTLYDYDFYGMGRNESKIDIKSIINHA